MADSLVFIGLTFLLAGFVKGVIGLGLPTFAIGLLGLVMAPAQAAALLVMPALVTNVWQLLAGPRLGPLLRRLWPMMLGICLGIWAAAGLLTNGPSARASAALGIALVIHAVAGLTPLRLVVSKRAEPWLSPIIGAATGAVTAATGVLVIPAVPYLQALALERDELVQSLGLSFTVSTVALAVSLAQAGVLQPMVAGASLLALAPAAAGMALGQSLRTRIRAAVFRACFFVGLLALGAHIALRELG